MKTTFGRRIGIGTVLLGMAAGGLCTPQGSAMLGHQATPVQPSVSAGTEEKPVVGNPAEGSLQALVHRVLPDLSLQASRGTATDTSSPSGAFGSAPESPSLLDELGELKRRVSDQEVDAWKQELNTGHPPAARAALLHLWVGEYEMAHQDRINEGAWHFRTVQTLVPKQDPLYGLAAFEGALALADEGAYGEAAEAFHRLMMPQTGLAGYSRRSCALWYRRQGATAGAHQQNREHGIPEPTRLDPLCGAAALAAGLRSLHLPYDKETVLRSCHVTDRGSSMADLVEAGPRLGMVVRALKADDKGLMALPKPLIAYVEEDHFIAVDRADAKGVSYLCSDCGCWPGGRVNLTWEQWHRVDPGIYGTMTRTGSSQDKTIKMALALSKHHADGMRTAGRGPLIGLGVQQLVPSIAVLSGHLFAMFPLQALYNIICVAGATTVFNTPVLPEAPTDGEPVNLANGSEEHDPAPDLTVYNPTGPAVVWQRNYQSLRETSTAGYRSNDFGGGWSHGYNIAVYDAWLPSSGGSYPHYLVFGNGSQIPFAAPSVPTAAQPVVDCTMIIPAPLFIQWNYLPGDANGYYTITFKDRTQWVTTAANTATHCYSLAQIKDRMGNGLQMNYGSPISQGGWPLLSGISDIQTGKSLLGIQRAQDGTGNVSSVSDCYGRTVSYRYETDRQYNAWGQTLVQELTGVSQIYPTGSPPAPSRWSYGYQGYPYQVPGGNIVTQPYLHTIGIPSPTGVGTSTSTINYAPNTTFVTSMVDGNGNARSYTEADFNHTKVTVTDSQGQVNYSYTAGFDNRMRPTTVTDGQGRTISSLIYYGGWINWADSVTQYVPNTVIDAAGRQTICTWDHNNNLTSVTTPRGITTVYHWDYVNFPLGELDSVQVANRAPVSFSYYEPNGLTQSVTGPKPGTTGTGETVTSSCTYDDLGNPLTITGPGNDSTATTTTTFNYTQDGSYIQSPSIGQPLTVTDNLGKVSRFRYDSQGRPVTVIDPLGNRADTSYNIADQVLITMAPPTTGSGGPRAYAANSYQFAGGSIQGTAFHAENGQLLRWTTYQCGQEGEMLSSTGSGGTISNTYDSEYRAVSMTDNAQHTTSYHYGAAGYLDQVTYPGGETERVTDRNESGQILRSFNAKNVETRYVYNDVEGALTDVIHPSSPDLNKHVHYDPYGRTDRVTDGSGTRKYTFDDSDGVTRVQTQYTGLSTPLQLNYGYNPDGSRSWMSTPAGMYTYNYDGDGRMQRLTNPCGQPAQWSYGDSGQLQSQTLGNGVKTNYFYNPGGQLTELQNVTSTNSLLSDFGRQSGIQYDSIGNPTSVAANVPGVTAATGLTTYQYDAKDQLTQEQSARNGNYTNSFAYDAAGNPITFKGQTQTFNQKNQNNAITYDSNGNPASCNGQALTFDAEDNMTGYGSAMTAGYTGEGLRAWKQTSAGKTFFLYDGGTPVCEVNASGTVTAFNTVGPTGVLARNTASGSTWYTYDPQGSVCQRLDRTGNVQSTCSYDAFGAPLAADASGDPFGYGGQSGYYTDSESGLLLLTHRYYDPHQGRFLNRDPIGYAGGLNLYAYCSNGPVGASDPDGTYSENWLRAGNAVDFGLARINDGFTIVFEATHFPWMLLDFHPSKGPTEAFGWTAGCNDSGKASGWQVIGAWGNWAGSVGGAATMLAGPVMRGISALADVMGAEAATGEIVADATGAVTNTNCFVAGTLVQMADGTTRSIEQIKDGDLVWSRDEKTGKLEARHVLATTHHKSGEVIHLVLADPQTGTVVQEFTVSVEHPFYVDGKGFVGASHLGIGSQIVTRAGPKFTVKSMVVMGRAQGWELYNFTVAKDHTYFVGEKWGGVWVHNVTTSAPDLGRQPVVLGTNGTIGKDNNALGKMLFWVLENRSGLPQAIRTAITEDPELFEMELKGKASEVHFNIAHMGPDTIVTNAEFDWISANADNLGVPVYVHYLP